MIGEMPVEAGPKAITASPSPLTPPRRSPAHTGERGRPSVAGRGRLATGPSALKSAGRLSSSHGVSCAQVPWPLCSQVPGASRRPAGAAAPPPAGRLVPGGWSWALARVVRVPCPRLSLPRVSGGERGARRREAGQRPGTRPGGPGATGGRRGGRPLGDTGRGLGTGRNGAAGGTGTEGAEAAGAVLGGAVSWQCCETTLRGC
jgi:hypothetical protein